jgi:hypothetical protein
MQAIVDVFLGVERLDKERDGGGRVLNGWMGGSLLV